MFQINIRNHPKATTIALRGVMEEEDGPDLQNQLEFIVKYDNKLQLVFDCTRLVNTSSTVWDSLHTIFLRLSYLREITFCGANDAVKRLIQRSRISEFCHFENDYQEVIEALHPKTESTPRS